MRIEELEACPHFVYRAWDATGRLLYVGCSLDVPSRLKSHKRAPWFPMMATHTIEGPYSFRLARHIEWTAIQTEGPRFNGQTREALAHSRGRAHLFNEVAATAMANGEDMWSALEQADKVCELEYPTWIERLAELDSEAVA